MWCQSVSKSANERGIQSVSVSVSVSVCMSLTVSVCLSVCLSVFLLCKSCSWGTHIERACSLADISANNPKINCLFGIHNTFETINVAIHTSRTCVEDGLTFPSLPGQHQQPLQQRVGLCGAIIAINRACNRWPMHHLERLYGFQCLTIGHVYV